MSYATAADVSSPAIGSDGRVYVGSSDYRIYALTSAGGLAWSYATAAVLLSSWQSGVMGACTLVMRTRSTPSRRQSCVELRDCAASTLPQSVATGACTLGHMTTACMRSPRRAVLRGVTRRADIHSPRNRGAMGACTLGHMTTTSSRAVCVHLSGRSCVELRDRGRRLLLPGNRE